MLSGIGRAHGTPGVPRDLQDYDGQDETDQRVSEREAERDDDGARDDAEGDVAVDAGMVAIGHERGAVEPPAGSQAYTRRQLVPEEPDDTGTRPAQRGATGARGSIKPGNRLVQRNARRDEDRADDREAAVALTTGTAKNERNTEWDRGQGIARVVDEIGKQRHRARRQEHTGLQDRRDREDHEAQPDRAQPRLRTQHGAIDKAMRMTVGMRVPCAVGTVSRGLVQVLPAHTRLSSVRVTARRGSQAHRNMLAVMPYRDEEIRDMVIVQPVMHVATLAARHHQIGQAENADWCEALLGVMPVARESSSTVSSCSSSAYRSSTRLAVPNACMDSDNDSAWATLIRAAAGVCSSERGMSAD